MNDSMKLLDNGWKILLFRDGMGSYSALAIEHDASLDGAFNEWADHEPEFSTLKEAAKSVFEGPNRYCGCGFTPAEALTAVTEKVLFRRLPERQKGGE